MRPLLNLFRTSRLAAEDISIDDAGDGSAELLTVQGWPKGPRPMQKPRQSYVLPVLNLIVAFLFFGMFNSAPEPRRYILPQVSLTRYLHISVGHRSLLPEWSAGPLCIRRDHPTSFAYSTFAKPVIFSDR